MCFPYLLNLAIVKPLFKLESFKNVSNCLLLCSETFLKYLK